MCEFCLTRSPRFILAVAMAYPRASPSSPALAASSPNALFSCLMRVEVDSAWGEEEKGGRRCFFLVERCEEDALCSRSSLSLAEPRDGQRIGPQDPGGALRPILLIPWLMLRLTLATASARQPPPSRTQPPECCVPR